MQPKKIQFNAEKVQFSAQKLQFSAKKIQFIAHKFQFSVKKFKFSVKKIQLSDDCRVWVDCKCMEFVATGWCARKSLSFYQTMRNKKSFFWWFGKSKVSKTKIVYQQNLFGQ